LIDMRIAILHLWLRRAAAIALACAASGAIAIPAAGVDDAGDAKGELIGELIFRADLLSSLDTLCPRGAPMPDWRAALPPLPPEATTPELLDLSRRLGADAGQQLLRETGGCRSVDFAVAYDESRQTFDELIARWRQL
jgi:hypothetical protein